MLAPAQLGNVWLAFLRFEENPDFDRDDLAVVTYDIEAKLVIKDVHRNDDDTETHAVVRLDAPMHWFRDDEPTDYAPFELEAAVGAYFRWPSVGIDEDSAKRWLNFNALHLLWPYLRTYVSDVTAKSRLPTMTIYTLDVPESPDFESEEDVRLGVDTSNPDVDASE